MPTYTFATGVPNIVPAVYSTDDAETDLNAEETATASNGVLSLTLDVGDYYAEWTDQGDTHTTAGAVANPAGVQSLGEVESGGSSHFRAAWNADDSDPVSLVGGTPSPLTKAFLESAGPVATDGTAPTMATDGSFVLPAGSYHLYLYGDVLSDDPATNGETITLRLLADAPKLYVTDYNGTPTTSSFTATDTLPMQATGDGVLTEYEAEGYVRFVAVEDVTVHFEAATETTDATLSWTTVELLTV